MLNIGFFYGETPINRKKSISLVGKKINKPKNRGGLGVRHAKDPNHAFKMKVGWV